MPERVDDLFGFLRWWYGPPVNHLQARDIPGVPAPLCAWYSAEDAWDRRLAIQNTILRPHQLVAENGLTMFYVENQGVWVWSYSSGDDPEVCDKENEPHVPWSPTGARLSEFLVQAAMFEAIQGSPTGAAADYVDRAQYEALIDLLTQLSMTPWRWPGPDGRLFMGDRILAFGCESARPGTPTAADRRYEVLVAAKSEDDMAYIEGLGISWVR